MALASKTIVKMGAERFAFPPDLESDALPLRQSPIAYLGCEIDAWRRAKKMHPTADISADLRVERAFITPLIRLQR